MRYSCSTAADLEEWQAEYGGLFTFGSEQTAMPSFASDGFMGLQIGALLA